MTTIKLARRILAAVGLSCAVALAVPAAADAQSSHAAVSTPSTISWAVAPSSAKGGDGRTHFSYSDIKPGSVVHDYVGITNYSDKPVTFNVYASDGITTTAGSIGLAPAKQQPIGIGAWLRTEHASVTVPPKRELNEPIMLTVPANATPGDHVGGVIASVMQATKGGQVATEDRVGVAMYLRVSGPLHPILAVESLSISGYHGTPNPFGGGGTTVSYTVHNTGNVRLGGTETVSVTGPFGVTLATVHPPSLEEVLPGDSVRVTARLSGIFPAGPLTVHVVSAPSEEPGSVHVTVALVGGSRTASMWATPWPQLVLLIVLVALGLGIWRFVRARRRSRNAALQAAVERGRREAAAQLASVGGRADEENPTTDPE